MVRGLEARVPAQAGVWVEAEAKVEAGWVGHLRPDRVEIASAQVAVIKWLMLQASPVMQRVVRNAVRK